MFKTSTVEKVFLTELSLIVVCSSRKNAGTPSNKTTIYIYNVKIVEQNKTTNVTDTHVDRE